MSTHTLPEAVTVKVADITPYWRNPRRIPAEAVQAVKTSIERYGYQQPIIVDQSSVVIVGHTRLQALQEMGVKEVPVYVSTLDEEKAKQFRLVDNRTSEMTSWDHGALVLELREFEDDLLDEFFPDVDLEITTIDDAMVTGEDVEKATKKALDVPEEKNVFTTEVVCPSCFHSFEVRTETLPGVTRADLMELEQNDGGTE